MVTNQKKNQHLMWRAGFGPALQDLSSLAEAAPRELFRKLLRESALQPQFIEVATEEVKDFYAKSANAVKVQVKQSEPAQVTSDFDRRRLARLSRLQIRELNVTWLGHIINSKQQLREKMSLFWHGHFAAVSGNIIHQQKLLQTIRVNALGNFRQLLKEVSKSASIITFLNNNQNRKNHPNENFARELMELFTIGRGNYTENDVREAARAFTGWGAESNGDFTFRPRQHDFGEKTFMQQKGNFNGEDILNILLGQKKTAEFIATKVYRFFVNETLNHEHIKLLANKFYDSGYDITTLLSNIFESDWFYAAHNVGVRIKSPVELIAGIRRTMGVRLENEQVELVYQRLLGQVLFQPPNVAGWPGGTSWIDSSSLMLRLQLPKLLIQQDELMIKPKSDDDNMMGTEEQDQVNGSRVKAAQPKRLQTARGSTSWKEYINVYLKVNRSELVNQISSLLLLNNPTNNDLITKKFADSSTRESFIQTASIYIMCMPEYQLC